jgi:inner membrane protein
MTGVVAGAGLAGVMYLSEPVYGELLGLEVNTLTLVGAALFGFAIGTLSILAHLLGDVITITGIRPFAIRGRMTKRYRLARLRAADNMANDALFFIGFVMMIVALFAGAYLSGALPEIPSFNIPIPLPDITLPRL